MKKLKISLFSGRGMAVVNTLFFLSLALRNTGVIFAAYSVWIVYLAFGIKFTGSRSVKIIHAVLIAFAAVMIAVNLFFLLRG
jgi:uncharacterized membrane protein (UPF0136 family)